MKATYPLTCDVVLELSLYHLWVKFWQDILFHWVSGLGGLPRDFPDGSDSKEPACNEGDLGSIPGLGRSPLTEEPGGLQFMGLQSQTWLSNGGTRVKNLPSNAEDIRDTGLIPVSERSPGEGNGNLLQYSCLENSMDRGAWKLTVHKVTQSWTQLKWLSTHAHTINVLLSNFLYSV